MPLNLGFWKYIHKNARAEKRPLYVLAPMADVTDVAFRKLINKYGKPDVTWTEFVSADGLVRATPEGKAKLMRDLAYDSDLERPIVAQLFSSNPEYMKQAAALVEELGFDGIDINMGCPDKSIEKQGCGAAMIKNPAKAKEIILAAKEGAPSLPVSVKTRIGYNKNELETWLPALLEAEPAVITIHARTRKEMSKVPARWEHVKRAVEIRDEFFKKKYGKTTRDENTSNENAQDESVQNENMPGEMRDKTLIFGNGDALSIEDAYQKAEATGADGVMLGRAIFGNPWLFRNLENRIRVSREGEYENLDDTGDDVLDGKDDSENTDESYIENSTKYLNCPDARKAYIPSVEEKLRVMVEHTKEFESALGDIKSFAIMKKHYKAYVNGFDGAKELRAELMEKAENASEVEGIVEEFLRNFLNK